ncbi:galactosyl transferase GMA12/MNN10 family-domain-containing protein [Immersiella caudata]|uniref:Galactosyl transferase GMA12/MNN10 family-domain-containing protein n=1 Tax=Immersiella caudata TaxID=314043 RepID=A0AA39WE83_9PEZI|nr:galactosyl transferase GMA12/MNN10 family-domain-containing protein [Immersiella caudata]
MHFAYPPRKSSNPPPYLRAAKLPGLRRSRLKIIAAAGFAFLVLIYLLTRPTRHAPYKSYAPTGNPPAVIVSVFDEMKYDKAYLDLIKDNRIQYAAKHGMLCYETFFPKVGDYDIKGAPTSWTNVVAVRHALTKFPDCKFVWFLDQNAFIMNPDLTIEEHVMKPARLEGLMIKDYPVVPPDSIIKTFSHLKGQDVDFVVTQDKDGMSASSYVVRNGDWARFFLETWFDPLYRSYNFQRAETHALEHIVQWHPTVLARLALVPQKTLNTYSRASKGVEYQDGDFVVVFNGCTSTQECDADAHRYVYRWQSAFKST